MSEETTRSTLLPRALVYLAAFSVLSLGWAAACGMWQYQDFADGVAPLEPRAFEALTVVTVGTGDAYENHKRLGPATVVGVGSRIVLVDAGRGVAEALRAAGIPVDQPDTVFLTSLLPESTLGLDDLLHTGWLAERAQPLRVVGPPGSEELVEGLMTAHRTGVAARATATGRDPAGAAIAVDVIDDGWSAVSGDLSVRAAGLPGGPLPGRAYRFEAGSKSLVVAGPGWAPEALIELARGAGLLVHAAVNRESVELAIEGGADEGLRREASLLLPLAEIGSLAQRAGVATLVLIRLRPPPLLALQYERRAGEGFRGEVVVAADGDEFTP